MTGNNTYTSYSVTVEFMNLMKEQLSSLCCQSHNKLSDYLVNRSVTVYII